MNRKFSNDNHYSNKQGNYKENDRKMDIGQAIGELGKKSLTEKEFYEKCKPILEYQNDKFGLTLSKLFSILIERGFSAYQLFKMLMNSKAKNKLKLLNIDDEKGFYPKIFEIMKTQKEPVIIEGLKVLGYMTSECLQNISQDTQLALVEFLMQYTKHDLKNQGLLRLSYNCMGNIFTHSNFKIHDEKNELFNNSYEILKMLTPIEALEDSNNIRLLSAMLRVLNYLFVDIKNFPLNTLDFFITQLIRYLYLGTVFFPLPKSAYFSQNDASSDSGHYTSSSEISDQDDGEEKKKHDETCSKIRNYCAASLASLFRQNPKSIPQYLQVLLPRKVFAKDLRKISQKILDPLIISNEPIGEKKKRRMMVLLDIKQEFNDPNLLYLLLFEDSNKIRLSVCKAISALLDGYHNDKLLLTIDGEKLEKSKIDPYSSKSHEFYQFFKNLSLGILISLQVEIDESFVNHLLRLFSTMISHQSYEKVGFLTIDCFVTNVLLKIIPRYYHHTIYLSCIACFSSIVSTKTKFKNFESLALTQTFDIIAILLKEIKDSLDVVATSKEVKFLKGDRIADSTILLESIISLSKFPKHYVENLLEKIEDLVYITEKVKLLDRKYSNVAYKLIEETMRYISTDKGDFENQEPEIEHSAPKPILVQRKTKSLENISIFHGFLEKLFSSMFNGDNTDFLEYVLNILYYLDEDDWKNNYHVTKGLLIGCIDKLNSSSSLKQSLLRMLGKICTFSYFVSEEEFPKLVFKSLKNNISEKNNNIMIKNSWVLANLCANLNRFNEFTIEENHDFLNMILVYCTSNKEKLISNGYRALGYFISNNSDDILNDMISDPSKGQDICNSLREVYLRSFEAYSVKVCWNICVSFSNILKMSKPKFMEKFFCDEILENMKSILTSKNNFKTQIHCVEMLHLAYDQFPKHKSFKSLIKDLSTIYFMADEGQVDITEMRYLPQLRININKLLIKLLKDRDILNAPGDLLDILNNMPHKFFKIVYDNLYIHYKENQEAIAKPWEEDKTDDSVMGEKNKKIDNFDEMAVKGLANQNKIAMSTRRLHKPEMSGFKDHLASLIGICKQTATLIDNSDDINVPFSVYESIKQLADLNLDTSDEFVSLEIYQF